jgi:uncharacterized membrane protein YccC
MRRPVLLSALLLIAVSAAAGQRFWYVYSRGSGSRSTISHGNLDDVLRLQKRFTGAYLWAMLDGREYLIRDRAALDEVQRAAAPVEVLGSEQRALNEKMKPFERREERLDQQIDAISDHDEDEMPETRARLRELESQLRDVERQLRQYEHEERRLDQREDALDRQFDDEVRRIVERAIRSGTATRAAP